MTWTIKFSETALKHLKKIAHKEAERIIEFVQDRLMNHPNPKILAKHLTGEWKDYWRYRVGNYRLICSIDTDVLIIEIIYIGHRREIYD